MDADRPQRVLTELRAFLGADPVPPRDDPQKQVVELFHRVAASVPAYRKFLDDHDVDPGAVRTFADFQRLPLLTKDTYHRQLSAARAVPPGSHGRLRHDRGVLRLDRGADRLASFPHR